MDQLRCTYPCILRGLLSRLFGRLASQFFLSKGVLTIQRLLLLLLQELRLLTGLGTCRATYDGQRRRRRWSLRDALT